MSAEFVSAFILVSSAGLVFFWLRSACQTILRTRFAQDYGVEVARGVPVEYHQIRTLLRESPATLAGCDDPLDSLERDYKALTYLLRKTSTTPVGHYSSSERLLILDFQLLRFWVRLKCLLALNNWRTGLLEMATILEYFGNVLGQRLRTSLNLLAPQPAMAGTASGPFVNACSYCRNVCFPAGRSGARWVTAKKYLRLGGEKGVILSHGICPPCLRNIVRQPASRR
jgi:hypothetical protein